MIDHASLITQPDTTTFYITGGTLRGDAASYVVRRADQDLYDNLCRGEFSYVLTSRQMGKSSLMIRTAARLREIGVGVVVLDLTSVGQNLSAEQWYDGLLSRIGRQLQLEDDLEKFWLHNSRLGPLQRWMSAIDEVVLPGYPGKLVIFIDEIDTVRSLHFSTDEFFAGIRELYNRRTEEPELERLTFCLLGVASPSDLIRDTRMTPFNIGQRIELHDFTEEEARPLAAGLGRSERTGYELLRRVFYWTGGHPYLTQRLCRGIAEDENVSDANGVDTKCKGLFLESRAQEGDDNLLFVRERMLRSEVELAGLLTLYDQVHQGKKVRDDETSQMVSVLRLSGITRVEDGRLKVRNGIYDRVFDSAWVNDHMPDAELRRQRAAYRRGLIRATGIAALILIVIIGLAFWSLLQRNIARAEAERADQHFRKASLSDDQARKALAEAEGQRQLAEDRQAEAEHQRQEAFTQQIIAQEQRDLARNQQEINRRQLYAAQMGLAGQAWRDRDLLRLKELVENQIPKAGQEDLRGFEWYYYLKQLQDGPQILDQSETVLRLAFSPDGKKLFSVGQNLIGKLWDVRSGRLLTTYGDENEFISGIGSIALSPDGTKIAFSKSNGPVVYDTATGNKLYSLNCRFCGLAMAFTPDGRKLAGVGNKNAKIWDLATGRELVSIKGMENRIGYSLKFSSDGKALCVGGTVLMPGSTEIWVYDVDTGNELFAITGQRLGNRAIDFSPNGRLLATGSSGNMAKLWDLQTGREVSALKDHTAAVTSLSFTADGTFIVTGSMDQTVKIWETATAKLVKTIPITGAVTNIDLSNDDKLLVTEGPENFARLWNINSGQKLQDFRQAGSILSSDLSSDGKYLATAGSDGSIRLWDLGKSNEKRLYEIPRMISLNAIDLSSDGNTLVVGGEGVINFLNTDNGSIRFSINTGSDSAVWAVALSPGRHKLASSHTTGVGSTRGIFNIWAVGENKPLFSHAIGEIVPSVAFSSDEKRVAAAAWTQSPPYNQVVHIYDSSTGREVAALNTGHKGKIEKLYFSPDGKRVITTSQDGTSRIWDSYNLKLLGTIHDRVIAISPNSKLYAGLDYSNRSIEIYDAESFRVLRVLKGHTNTIQSITFSPNCRRLVSSSSDGTVRIWNVSSGEEITELTPSIKAITRVIFSPDGDYLYAISRSGAIEKY